MVYVRNIFIVAFMFSFVMPNLEKQNINLTISFVKYFFFALCFIASESIKFVFKYFIITVSYYISGWMISDIKLYHQMIYASYM